MFTINFAADLSSCMHVSNLYHMHISYSFNLELSSCSGHNIDIRLPSIILIIHVATQYKVLLTLIIQKIVVCLLSTYQSIEDT